MFVSRIPMKCHDFARKKARVRFPPEPRGLYERAVAERLKPLGEGVGVVRESIPHLHAPPRRSIGVERVERTRPSLRCQDRFDSRKARLVVA